MKRCGTECQAKKNSKIDQVPIWHADAIGMHKQAQKGVIDTIPQTKKGPQNHSTIPGTRFRIPENQCHVILQVGVRD